MRGLSRLERMVRRLTGQVAPRGIILLYHRIANLPTDPFSLAVTPRHFSEHLEVLREHTLNVRLSSLKSSLKGDRPLSVISFDDGYLDNLLNARPALEKHSLSAILFVATGYVGGAKEFWWDQLERIFLHANTLPSELVLQNDHGTHAWSLAECSSYTEEIFERDRGWNIGQIPRPGSRQDIFFQVWNFFRILQPERRDQLLKVISHWSNFKPDLEQRMMRASQINEICQNETFELGAHTVSHPVLSSLPNLEQRREIEDSKGQLENMVGRRITAFSYPHGGRADYDNETVALVKAAGFACACSNFEGCVTSKADWFQLPRVYVHDCDGDTFLSQIRRIFG